MEPHTLSGVIEQPGNLQETEIDQMFGIIQKYFEGYSRDNFLRDLYEKDGVVLLRSADEIKGFTTFQFLSAEIDGQRIRGVFSGDTIVEREFWGKNPLATIWGRHMLEIAQREKDPLYWFLISSGYRTYRLLSRFFKDFYPRHDREFPERELRIMEAFAQQKFPDEYVDGLVTFKRSRERLRPGVAGITEDVLRDPHARFFAERNPGHVEGVELACIVRISPDNIHPEVLEMLR